MEEVRGTQAALLQVWGRVGRGRGPTLGPLVPLAPGQAPLRRGGVLPGLLTRAATTKWSPLLLDKWAVSLRQP